MYLPVDLYAFFRELEMELPVEFNELFSETPYSDISRFIPGFGQHLQNMYMYKSSKVYCLYQSAGIMEPDDMADMTVRLYYLYLYDAAQTRHREAKQASCKKAAGDSPISLKSDRGADK